MGNKKKTNPRSANGSLRRKHRARFKAMGAPCGICRGKLGPIRYNEPSNAEHPFSFVIDEIKPISKWQAFGYSSARAAAEDWENLQAAHWICNAKKSDKINYKPNEQRKTVCMMNAKQRDGKW